MNILLSNGHSSSRLATALSFASVAALFSISHANALDPAAIPVGETAFTPSVQLDFVSIDNTFRTENDPIDSTQTTLRPRLEWVADRRLLELSAVYQGDFAFSDESASSYADSSITAGFAADFSSRNRTTANLSFERSHIDIGTNFLSNVTQDEAPDVAEFNEVRLQANHRYGAANATGNVIIGGSVRNRSHSNLDAFTNGRDFSSFSANAQFSYRVSSDTRTFIGVRFSNFDFDADVLDRNEAEVFAGLAFSATGALSGRIELGASNVQPDLDTRNDSTEFSVRTNLTYRPVDFANFTLDITREIDNTQAAINSVSDESPITTFGRLAWNHEWSSRISTVAAVNLVTFTTGGLAAEYEIVTPSFEIAYAVRRFLEFGFKASFETRSTSNSDLPGAQILDEFDRTQFGGFIRASL